MYKAILLTVVVFSSCKGEIKSNSKTGVDSIPKKTIPVVAPKLNFKYLYTSWVPVSMHYHDTTAILLPTGRGLRMVIKNNGDTGIQSFIPDTAEYRKYYETAITFQKDGQWDMHESDMGSAGTFTLDTINNVLTPDRFFSLSRARVDTVFTYNFGVLYVDEHFLLLDLYYGKEKFMYFYINENYAVKKNKWHFLGGG